MADEKRNPWRSVDANGYDYNSGEEFDPVPRQANASGAGTPQPVQQARAPQPAQPVQQARAPQPAQPVQQQPLSHADTSGMKGYLEQSRDAAVAEASGRVDRAVTQGVNELQRVREDANEQYQTQQNQIDLNERRALDNQALYMAANGMGKSGVGMEQYNSIQNAAAQNRVTLNNARTKTATDIARQMAELRATGEFEKSQAYLQATQQYLAQLAQLEQWAQEFDVGVDQFNAQMEQAERQYQLQLRQLEIAQSQWEQEFAEGQRQFNANLGYQYGALGENKRQFDLNFGEGQRQFDANLGYQYGALAEDKRQFDLNFGEGQRQFDANLGYQYGALAENKSQFEANYGLQKQQYADTKAAQNRQDAWAKAEAMMSVGMMPDEETLKAAGLSKEYAQLYMSSLQAAQELASQQAAAELENKQADTLKKISEASQKTGADASGDLDALATAFVESGSASPKTWLANNYKAYGFASKPDAEEFADAVEEIREELAKPVVKDAHVDFSPDDGIITFNGERFKELEEFVKYVNAHRFTESEWETLMRGIARWPELRTALTEEG